LLKILPMDLEKELESETSLMALSRKLIEAKEYASLDLLGKVIMKSDVSVKRTFLIITKNLNLGGSIEATRSRILESIESEIGCKIK